MGRAPQKVKTVAKRRHQITLEKYVTLRLTTIIDVEAETIEPATTQRERDSNASHIDRALKAALRAEKASGVERQWDTEATFDDPDNIPDGYSTMLSCIVIDDTHISITEETPQ